MSKEVITLGRISYGLDLDRHTGELFSDEVWIETFTEWRGRLVRAEVHGDRYTHSAGLSDWRAWVRNDGGNGYVESVEVHYSHEPLTDTARQRINERLKPYLPGLIEQATTGARYTAALIREGVRVIKDAYDPTVTANRITARHAGALGVHGVKVLTDYAAALIAAGNAASTANTYAEDLKNDAPAVELPNVEGVPA